MRKITIFYDADYETMEGGGQKRLFEIARLAMNESTLVNWISFKFWKKGKSYKSKGITYDGFIKKPSFYSKNGDRSIFEPILYLFNCFCCIPRFINSKLLIIGQWPLIHIIPLVIFAKITNKIVYVEWWETLEEQWKSKGPAGYIGYLIENLTIKMSSYVTFVVDCEAEKELILKKNKKAKVVVINNGVNIEFFGKRNNEQSFHFISLGRLHPHKRVDLLVSATKDYIMRTNHEDVRVCIIGEGSERKNIENLIKSLGLQKNIILKGFVESYEEVVNLMEMSNVGILTTVAGGKGNVTINEMFAAELPVIAIGCEDGIDKSYIKSGLNGYITKNICSKELGELMAKANTNIDEIITMKNFLRKNKPNLGWQNTLKYHPLLKN